MLLAPIRPPPGFSHLLYHIRLFPTPAALHHLLLQGVGLGRLWPLLKWLWLTGLDLDVPRCSCGDELERHDISKLKKIPDREDSPFYSEQDGLLWLSH